VHAAGGRVAAHVTTDLVAPLVRAGVDSIEHGTAMDEESLRLMAQTGAAWTPTLCAVLGVPSTSPEADRRRARDYRRRLHELLPLAHRLGVPILAGTDTAGSLAREIALLAKHGLEPAAALTAATTTGYQFLGESFGMTGHPATLVTYQHDPARTWPHFPHRARSSSTASASADSTPPHAGDQPCVGMLSGGWCQWEGSMHWLQQPGRARPAPTRGAAIAHNRARRRQAAGRSVRSQGVPKNRAVLVTSWRRSRGRHVKPRPHGSSSTQLPYQERHERASVGGGVGATRPGRLLSAM
jgi:hypothetical protein